MGTDGHGDNVYGEFVCCENQLTLFQRECTFAFDSNNPCAPAGPNGCGICWHLAYNADDDVCSTSTIDCNWVICST
jgi:hypothetical protein